MNKLIKMRLKRNYSMFKKLVSRNYYLEPFASPKKEIGQVYTQKRQNIKQVNEGLVIISQIQRSGGTMLSQLFDSHPQCHMHPFELYIGYPKKWNWPELNLQDNPEKWFESLFEIHSTRGFQRGYSKDSTKSPSEPTIYPFIFLPHLQKKLFLECISNVEIKSQRDVLNCYMTSYFNAWLDYQGFYGDKKYVVSFVPRVNMHPESRSRFFRDYPDGKMISMVREPKNWYASAHRQNPKQYATPLEAAKLWKASVEGMLNIKRTDPNRIYLMSFEDLLERPETNMRAVAEFLGLEFDATLLTPTFQGKPIKANSVFSVESYGLLDKPKSRAQMLQRDEARQIDHETQELYAEAIRQIDSQ